ncbi:hypothetical protein [Sphaerisporangium fuscum]|uniref:hypothetical protein n=1 Tax=Sphaerisporangium fuscum TaxID=2835868 RepID=UPI0020299F7F|nr:hypothetical protein [Sphaerisporangium fuscum]
MRKIATVVILATTAMVGTVAAGGPPGHEGKQSVSEEQYRILMRQCRYADTDRARRECRAEVRTKYEIGKASTTLDCRTYSGVTVCGVLKLSVRQRQCVDKSVQGGLTYRRAEVECYAFSAGAGTPARAE